VFSHVQNGKEIDMKLYVTSDGWPFYTQPDGNLTDTPDPDNYDLGYDSFDEMMYWDDETREGTPADWIHFENLRKLNEECNKND
tara:strand:+ start:549 stop:800 length:252 start_codon:yes stop_codon:yes gene_type:complete